jgi:hypothetical protein
MRAQPIGNGLLTANVSEHFAAVVEALQFQGASADALRSLDDAGWQKTLQLCDDLHLALPLGLKAWRGFPNWVSDRLHGNLADTVQRFDLVQSTYRETAAALNKAGTPHVVLKGFTLAPDFVPAPQFRSQCDIDIYTLNEHVGRAVGALRRIGYKPFLDGDFRDADHVPTLGRPFEWKPTSNRYDPEIPLAIEIHFCLWNAGVSLIALPEVEEFWNRRVMRKLGALSFYGLHPVDQIGYFALHILRDVFLDSSFMHHALELATFLDSRSGDEAFWRDWSSLHSPRLRQMQAISFALASACFSSRVPEAVREQIELLPASQRTWIENCGGDLLARSFHRSRDGRLLQLLLTESFESRRRVLWRALSPGTISSPRRVAKWAEHPMATRKASGNRTFTYLAYLASRAAFQCGAILRFMAHGLTVYASRFTARQA